MIAVDGKNFKIEKIRENAENKIFSKYKKYEVAQKMGITPQSLQVILKKLETGKNVGIKTIERLALAGGITCEELLSQDNIQNLEIKD